MSKIVTTRIMSTIVSKSMNLKLIEEAMKIENTSIFIFNGSD